MQLTPPYITFYKLGHKTHFDLILYHLFYFCHLILFAEFKGKCGPALAGSIHGPQLRAVPWGRQQGSNSGFQFGRTVGPAQLLAPKLHQFLEQPMALKRGPGPIRGKKGFSLDGEAPRHGEFVSRQSSEETGARVGVMDAETRLRLARNLQQCLGTGVALFNHHPALPHRPCRAERRLKPPPVAPSKPRQSTSPTQPHSLSVGTAVSAAAGVTNRPCTGLLPTDWPPRLPDTV